MNKNILVAALSLVGLIASVNASAQTYVGADIGRAGTEVSDGSMSAKITDNGYKLYAGYEINKNFGAEIGYANLGSFTESSTSYKPSALYVAGTATYPINEQASVFGKLGVSANRAKISDAGNSDTFTHTGLLIGVGAAYNVTSNVALVLEYVNFGKIAEEGSAHVKTDLVSVGIRYKF